MVTKRGQAAMEFLMTYGWALLVVLVAIGALAFFGVLNPGQFLPDTCTMPPGISCIESQALGIVATNNVKLVLQNGFGDNMDMMGAAAANGYSLTLTNKPGITCIIGTPAPSDPLISGTTSPVSFTCTPVLTKGENIKGSLQINYTLGTSTLAHSKLGSIAMKVE